MKIGQGGFSLPELLLALALSLVLVLGVAQVFDTAKRTYLSQNAAARLQEDGRFVLSKMLQEIRMSGLRGCLRSISDFSQDQSYSGYAANAIQWDGAQQQLTLITADVGEQGGAPTWSLLSDCQRRAQVHSGAHPGGAGLQVWGLRRLFYRVKDRQLLHGSGLGRQQSVLLDGVEAFDLSFGMARSANASAVSSYSHNPSDPARIRSVRLRLTLADTEARVQPQSFTLVAALRNRLP